MSQKIQKNGKGDIRYFWKVNVKGEGSGTYRSRHSTTAGVRAEFRKHGKTVLSVTAKKA